MNKYLIIIAIVITLFSNSCNNDRIIGEQYLEIPETGWHKDSLVQFSLDINDTIHSLNMLFSVKNSEKYSFANLWLFVSVISPLGKKHSDTFEIYLADPSGKWLGKSNWGDYEGKLVYKSAIRFPTSGKYKLLLQQGMRVNNLLGVKKIGVLLEKNENVQKTSK